ncbi:MAG: methylenetetrahydrofolate--tRNA-(uracil(54)-C(5))-methyltransferase (FADH(2)-oxidizing) TrmFO [Chloroflexi bacterium]|nr:methylenetetrahydrofolate--tRNA-(uracil(54)-C(5))-methyltransferase (FADH(2)-oxidizing) TrmFO [Chloroflexota bacterium]
MAETIKRLNVIGGGLAGSEAAWQAAERGIHVRLWEMRPKQQTPAHVTDKLAELVCSNSLGSDLPDRASGLLKNELRRMNSLIMACADEARIPAGGALAVGREKFSELVTERIEGHPNIEVCREEATSIPDEPTIIASGPLTSRRLADEIAALIGEDYLYFYDALAPIVRADTINMDICFRASRYGRGEEDEGDYINCPMTEEEYRRFVDALLSAERIELRQFEREDPNFFEGCLPIEVLAARGPDALAFGPLRPVGLIDPRTGRRPYAVVQLRQDNVAGTLYNLVGFQTNLRWPEQRRVLRMIPGLEEAEFVRLGQMHRNTFLNSPTLLRRTMQYRGRDYLFFAGQITGVEGYVGNAGTGLLAGVNAARLLKGQPLWELPETTMLGALAHYVVHADPEHFQPMKANFGLLPPLDPPVRNKRERYAAYAARALDALERFLSEHEAQPA